MNAPTIIAALIVLVVFAAIVGKGSHLGDEERASRKGRLLLRRRLRGLRRMPLRKYPSFLTSGSPAPPGGRRRSISWN